MNITEGKASPRLIESEYWYVFREAINGKTTGMLAGRLGQHTITVECELPRTATP